MGAREGPPVSYVWTPASESSQLLPWLALLLLLLPQRNRFQPVWWGIGLAVALGLALKAASLTNETLAAHPIFQALNGAVLGLAAVWLLSPYLVRPARFLTCVATTSVLELAGLFAVVVQPEWGEPDAAVHLLLPTALLALVLGLALHLAAWSCQGRWGWGRLTFRALLWLMAGWALALLASAFLEGNGPSWDLVFGFLALTASTFGTLLPFLLLSLLHPFWRERLKTFLGLDEGAGPPPPPRPASRTPDEPKLWVTPD